MDIRGTESQSQVRLGRLGVAVGVLDLAAIAGMAAMWWLVAAQSSPLILPKDSSAQVVLEIAAVYFLPLVVAALLAFRQPGTAGFIGCALLPLVPSIPLAGAAGSADAGMLMLAVAIFSLLAASAALSVIGAVKCARQPRRDPDSTP
jgi:hypothetical protein